MAEGPGEVSTLALVKIFLGCYSSLINKCCLLPLLKIIVHSFYKTQVNIYLQVSHRTEKSCNPY